MSFETHPIDVYFCDILFLLIKPAFVKYVDLVYSFLLILMTRFRYGLQVLEY